MLDGEVARESVIERRVFLADIFYYGATRPSCELAAKRCERGDGSNRINFDTPIAKVLNIARQAEPLGQASREEAIADALHHSTNEISLCDFFFWHDSTDARTTNRGF